MFAEEFRGTVNATLSELSSALINATNNEMEADGDLSWFNSTRVGYRLDSAPNSIHQVLLSFIHESVEITPHAISLFHSWCLAYVRGVEECLLLNLLQTDRLNVRLPQQYDIEQLAKQIQNTITNRGFYVSSHECSTEVIILHLVDEYGKKCDCLLSLEGTWLSVALRESSMQEGILFKAILVIMGEILKIVKRRYIFEWELCPSES